MTSDASAPGEICDEWSEDEDGPYINVRWLFTASQVLFSDNVTDSVGYSREHEYRLALAQYKVQLHLSAHLMSSHVISCRLSHPI